MRFLEGFTHTPCHKHCYNVIANFLLKMITGNVRKRRTTVILLSPHVKSSQVFSATGETLEGSFESTSRSYTLNLSILYTRVLPSSLTTYFNVRLLRTYRNILAGWSCASALALLMKVICHVRTRPISSFKYLLFRNLRFKQKRIAPPPNDPQHSRSRAVYRFWYHFALRYDTQMNNRLILFACLLALELVPKQLTDLLCHCF